MPRRSACNKGQFSTIAALLVALIMVGAVIATYANIRNLPFQEPPKVLSALEEMNLSLKGLMQYAVGYYGSILQVTGNVSYAKDLTLKYLRSGFVYIAQSKPSWNPSFDIKYSTFSTCWYEPTSYSVGNLSVTYSLSGLGISQVTYEISSLLRVDVLDTVAGQARVLVTAEGGKPDLNLGRTNFFFYRFSGSAWKTVNPDVDPVVYSNGTYALQIPSGVDQSLYLMKVYDSRGITTTAFFSNSRKPQYALTFSWNASLYSPLARDTLVVESLQNGTLRWLGSNIQLSTQGKPILPIPVRALRVNQTVNGVDREVPFQVEDWGSDYRVPLGLTSNASLFGSRQMIVFLANHNVQRVTLWWNGRDTTTQTPYAFVNRYFTGDNPALRRLTNGILTLTVSASYDTITSSIAGGGITSTASFMRLNNYNPVYGSSPAYVIHHGIVRDIIQQEAEWSNGAPNSPNVYSQMYFTLPANATFYTYALRTVFVDSLQSRSLADLCAIRVSVSGGQQRTENGTSGGYPVSSTATGLFYNFTGFQNGWAHHWSEFISGSSGAGIMFRDNANEKLYLLDSIAGQKTGGVNVAGVSRVIEFNPVGRSQFPAAFTYSLDVVWHGAVVTFNGEPIYPTVGDVGLWVLVEHPPVVAVS
jgi:hypothetical protein